MDFGPFAILALFIAFAGIRVVGAIVRNRRTMFDMEFTDADRALVDQAAFFLLLPISVALHELGHATMVWVFGGEVVDFGYYVFAGFVSYQGRFTDEQQIIVAAAGVTVNAILAGLAFGFVLLKRPSMRPAYNELLVQFAILSIANALIFYPLLDLATGVTGGDFRQMYDGGVPWLSGIILAAHISILAGGFLAFKNNRFSAYMALLTGLPPHVRRGFLGGLRLAPGAVAQAEPLPLTESETMLRSAMSRIASGWPVPIRGQVLRRPDGPAVVAMWRKADGNRTVAVVWEPAGSVAIVLPRPEARTPVEALNGRVWQRWASAPSEDELVIGIRKAMEDADERAPSLFPDLAIVQ